MVPKSSEGDKKVKLLCNTGVGVDTASCMAQTGACKVPRLNLHIGVILICLGGFISSKSNIIVAQNINFRDNFISKHSVQIL